MSFLIGISAGAIVAWIAIAVLETNWEDIFPEQ
jgi:hypothetical protein